MGEGEVGPDALMQRVQELTERLQAVSDPAAREAGEGLVSAVIDLYGEGL